MRIAVVGSGIAGLATAWQLAREHQVVLFEAESRLGGHTHTHEVERDGRRFRVDSGFIVHNPANYPLLTAMLDELKVEIQPTTMGFSVHNARSGLQYSAGTLGGLFCQRRNLLSPRFYRMVADILRFYREAPALLAGDAEGPGLGDYLQAQSYSQMFIDEHLVPMASALWSSPSDRVLQFPARYLVQFMANHHMLSAGDRPQWKVVKGGSSRYIAALESVWRVEARLSSAVTSIARVAGGVEVRTAAYSEHFDQAVLACHSDQALALLDAPSAREQEILGAIRYQANDTVLHTDASLLPPNRRAWAAWNAHIPADPSADCTVSYCMNLLQGISSHEPFVVTLNRSAAIDPAKVIARMQYAHPEYTHASVAAQKRRAEINGVDGIWYCGAYWGWGFHEDGIRSGIEVVRALGVRWPQ
jgi:predicted NAD/FAD-binding protein